MPEPRGTWVRKPVGYTGSHHLTELLGRHGCFSQRRLRTGALEPLDVVRFGTSRRQVSRRSCFVLQHGTCTGNSIPLRTT